MSKLIFVTGASGFLASHVIYQLLQDGHRVRATARGKKVAALKELYNAYPTIEVVEVPDISTSQFPDALKDVDVVIHTATHLPSRVDEEVLYETAIGGSLNVLRQAEKEGVRKFVVTSSLASSLGDPTVQGVSYKPEHWNPATKEMAVGNPLLAYAVAKTLSERAIWVWAGAHPHIDVTTINPIWLYGPPAPLALRAEPGAFTSLSTNQFVYRLFTPPHAHLPFGFADFREVAKAHIGAALNSGPSIPGRKRLLFASPHGLREEKLLDLIREKRPEIGTRLLNNLEDKGDSANNALKEFDRLDIDFGTIEKVTGLKKSDFYTTEQTFLDTIDSLLAIEKEWKEKGFVVKNVDYTMY